MKINIFSWGSNSHGQLGQGLICEQIPEPTSVDFKFNVKSIVGGGKHSIILSEEGNLFSCGDNNQCQLSEERGVKCHLNFIKVDIKVRITKVSCGWDFNLSLSEDGLVYGWGGNSFGQLSISPKKAKYIHEPTKIFCEKVIDTGAGLRHSVVITEEGYVFSTGFGRKGQLGVIPTNGEKNLDIFTKVPGVSNGCLVSCGENHTILGTKDGFVFAWGDNKFGQLGVDPALHSHSGTPIFVNSIESHHFSKLASGWSHNAILTGDGNVLLWGRNDHGQLGEHRVDYWMPKNARFLNGSHNVCLGSHHGIALKHNGVICWGWNEHGNCANGICSNVCEPVKVNTFGMKPILIGSGAAHSFFGVIR